MTFNMHSMLRDENAEAADEKEFQEWLIQLSALIGEVDENGVEWDLFREGLTPEEAACEIEGGA
ncbi:hypothetical protein UXN85_20680 [Enterobacter hormaechei]